MGCAGCLAVAAPRWLGWPYGGILIFDPVYVCLKGVGGVVCGHPVTGESMVGAPVAVLSGAILLASQPAVGVVTALAFVFLVVGVLGVVDNIVFGEELAKGVLRIFSRRRKLTRK